MLIKFFKKIIVKGEKNKPNHSVDLDNMDTLTLTLPVQEKTEEGVALTEENQVNEAAALRIKPIQPIPQWASTWLRKPGADHTRGLYDEDEEEEENTAAVPVKLTNTEGVDDLEELPTESYLEPRNFEVREMVLRQIQNSRSVARYMCSTNDLVEDQIRKAMERGDFNNLRGKNKPIKFEENAYEDPELRLPFKILKDAGFAPYWVEEGKQIDAAIANCHMTFDKFVETLAYRRARYGYISRTPEFERRVMQVMGTCAHQLEEANKKIDKYNMIVPMYWLQRKKIDTEAEISALQRRLDEFLWGTTKEKKEKKEKKGKKE